jgi:hypothetical protein
MHVEFLGDSATSNGYPVFFGKCIIKKYLRSSVHNLKGNGDTEGNYSKLGSPLGAFSNASPDVFIGCIMKRNLREKKMSASGKQGALLGQLTSCNDKYKIISVRFPLSPVLLMLIKNQRNDRKYFIWQRFFS